MGNGTKLILSRLASCVAIIVAIFSKESSLLVSAAILAYIAIDWRLDLIEDQINDAKEE